MGDDSRLSMVLGTWAGDMDDRSALRTYPPESRGSPMAEDYVEVTGKYGRHPPSLAAHVRPPDRIHAAMDGMKPANRHPVLDGAARVPECPQLKASDHSMLESDERPRIPRPTRPARAL